MGRRTNCEHPKEIWFVKFAYGKAGAASPHPQQKQSYLWSSAFNPGAGQTERRVGYVRAANHAHKEDNTNRSRRKTGNGARRKGQKTFLGFVKLDNKKVLYVARTFQVVFLKRQLYYSVLSIHGNAVPFA